MKKKDLYVWLAFLILVCIAWFSLACFAPVLIEITLTVLDLIPDIIPDRLFMNADNGSDGGEDVPDLSSDTSDVSDMDLEEGPQHQLLQDQLDHRAEVHQREFEEQARMEDLEGQNRELDEQARQLEERARRLEERARMNDEIVQQLDKQSRQAEEQARQLEEEARQLRESISRNSHEITEIQERQARGDN